MWTVLSCYSNSLEITKKVPPLYFTAVGCGLDGPVVKDRLWSMKRFKAEALWRLVNTCETDITYCFYSAPKHSFASAVCVLRQIRPSVRHTAVLCQNEGKQRDAGFTIGQPNVSSFPMPRMVDGRRYCPGKIWVQRGRFLRKQPSCTYKDVHTCQKWSF